MSIALPQSVHTNTEHGPLHATTPTKHRSSPSKPAMSVPPKHKGIALGLFRQETDWNYMDFVTEIKSTGASHVAIVFSHYLKNDRSSTIYELKKYTAPLATIEQTIEQVHHAGMKVFLFPILRVEDKSNGGWRGTLKPNDLTAFFRNYEDYILQMAQIAHKHKVDLFSIGSELSTMDLHTDQWRRIIKRVRKRYHGKITYSANWDHFHNVAFFDDLDYLGVTGYFQLSQQTPPFENTPSTEELIHSWREIFMRLRRWQHQFDKQLIFTEVGYLSQKGAASKPWDEGAREAVDLEIQRRCYDSFIRVWDNEPRLEGVYFWNWFDWEGENDMEYTPRNKPAEREIKNWFSATP